MWTSLKKLVGHNSMLWGEEVAQTYHAEAAADMQAHWDMFISPVLTKHPFDFSVTADFAAGYGRNSDFLMQYTDNITLIDVNQHNLDYCAEKYKDHENIKLLHCNGYDLSNIKNDWFSFFYTFDSVVHFPQKIVASYIPEIYRVVKPGGLCFIHHSNYSASPRQDFRKNPHWRNHMSAEIFAKIANKSNFEVVDQIVHGWGGVEDLDCITVLRKPEVKT